MQNIIVIAFGKSSFELLHVFGMALVVWSSLHGLRDVRLVFLKHCLVLWHLGPALYRPLPPPSFELVVEIRSGRHLVNIINLRLNRVLYILKSFLFSLSVISCHRCIFGSFTLAFVSSGVSLLGWLSILLGLGAQLTSKNQSLANRQFQV